MSYSRGHNNNFSVTADRNGSRSFRGDHDDRWSNHSNNDSNRGGSRGSRGSSRGYRGNNRRGGYRNFNSNSSRYRTNQNGRQGNEDEDGDVSMAGDSNSRNQRSRYNPYGSNRYQRGGRNNSRSNRGHSGPATGSYRKNESWFKVMIPFGASLTKEELYKMILDNIVGDFEPAQYSTDEKRAYFFIKGVPQADSLRSISRRITKPDGHKLVFHISPSAPPLESIDEKTLEKLKVCMSDRYDPTTQLLNLSALALDENLRNDNIVLPLNRASTMTAVTNIVREHIPELTGLDVSKNKMLSAGHMAELVKAAPNVTSLNIGSNQIQSLHEIEKLKGWSGMTELILEGNDFCKNFSSQATYISAVRKIFPKVVKLDGNDLPPPITFDLETNLTLPDTKGSYFVNEDVKNFVVPFIKEYYTIYDSDKRRDLIPAYDENAQFSLCVCKNPLLDKQMNFQSYLDESRNLKIIGHYDQDKLAKRIKTGVLGVVSMLESLPKTTHDVNSFKVDVSLATPTMISFVLHGVFKENECKSDKPFIRTFSRTFVTIPKGSGMVIINDMLTLSNATPEQTKTAFKGGAPTPSSSPVSSSQSLAGPSVPNTSSPASFLTPEQIKMVENFVLQSGMNAEFSLQCLKDNGWDYLRSGEVFTKLHSEGKIPATAFVKTEL